MLSLNCKQPFYRRETAVMLIIGGAGELAFSLRRQRRKLIVPFPSSPAQDTPATSSQHESLLTDPTSPPPSVLSSSACSPTSTQSLLGPRPTSSCWQGELGPRLCIGLHTLTLFPSIAPSANSLPVLPMEACFASLPTRAKRPSPRASRPLSHSFRSSLEPPSVYSWPPLVSFNLTLSRLGSC